MIFFSNASIPSWCSSLSGVDIVQPASLKSGRAFEQAYRVFNETVSYWPEFQRGTIDKAVDGHPI